ncbi:MAG TPA: hypothetical protein VL485_10300 [Ktedonobacteraceae bacterium]|nr:hypothetical protein [Ktedonobacteraceae bacterium]
MKQHSSGFVIGIIVSIVLGFGILAGVWLSLQAVGSLGYEPGVLRATKNGANQATLNLSTYPDSHVCHSTEGEPQLDWVTYCSSTSLEVPPNSTITVVIDNYDGASTLVNNFFSQVHGTIGGVMTVNNKTVTQLDPQDIGHTFTLQSTPDSAYPIFVSVPILGVADDAPNAVTINGNDYPKPNVISFQFRTGPAGTNYVWHCYDPCGEDRDPPYGFTGPMSTTGYMAGTLAVVNY